MPEWAHHTITFLLIMVFGWLLHGWLERSMPFFFRSLIAVVLAAPIALLLDVAIAFGFRLIRRHR